MLMVMNNAIILPRERGKEIGEAGKAGKRRGVK